jgi:hypothetical protein
VPQFGKNDLAHAESCENPTLVPFFIKDLATEEMAESCDNRATALFFSPVLQDAARVELSELYPT